MLVDGSDRLGDLTMLVNGFGSLLVNLRYPLMACGLPCVWLMTG